MQAKIRNVEQSNSVLIRNPELIPVSVIYLEQILKQVQDDKKNG